MGNPIPGQGIMTSSTTPKLQDFKVTIFDSEYLVRSETRTKAVTEAISRFKKDFPGSKVPSAILRSLSRTSTVDILDVVDRCSVEKIFGGEEDEDVSETKSENP